MWRTVLSRSGWMGLGLVGGVAGTFCYVARYEPVLHHWMWSDECHVRFPRSEADRYRHMAVETKVSEEELHHVAPNAFYPRLISSLEVGPNKARWGSSWHLEHPDGHREPIFQQRSSWFKDWWRLNTLVSTYQSHNNDNPPSEK